MGHEGSLPSSWTRLQFRMMLAQEDLGWDCAQEVALLLGGGEGEVSTWGMVANVAATSGEGRRHSAGRNR